uniref:Putative secreted protein n=1 Tax=Ixodes ricinus TaxID=34613 RepID=A0A6B0TXW8_IXORI
MVSPQKVRWHAPRWELVLVALTICFSMSEGEMENNLVLSICHAALIIQPHVYMMLFLILYEQRSGMKLRCNECMVSSSRVLVL